MDTPAAGHVTAERGNNVITYALLATVVLVATIFAFSSNALPNHWYGVFKTVHLIFAVAWIGGGMLVTILGLRAQRETDPGAVVTIARQAAFAGEKIFAPAGLVVFVMGISMMINTNWGWGTFWIDAGLIGYALTFVTGIAVLSPLAKKIEASAEHNGPEHPETIALVDRVLLIARFDLAVLLLVIADMATKPFS
jgi:uncharacterized membrane protein